MPFFMGLDHYRVWSLSELYVWIILPYYHRLLFLCFLLFRLRRNASQSNRLAVCSFLVVQAGYIRIFIAPLAAEIRPAWIFIVSGVLTLGFLLGAKKFAHTGKFEDTCLAVSTVSATTIEAILILIIALLAFIFIEFREMLHYFLFQGILFLFSFLVTYIISLCFYKIEVLLTEKSDGFQLFQLTEGLYISTLVLMGCLTLLLLSFL